MKCKFSILIFLLVSVASVSDAQNIDINILKSINPQHPDAAVWKIASGSIDYTAGVLSFGTLAYGFIKKDKAIQVNGYELLISVASNVLIAQGLKTVFNRTRPADKYPGEVFVTTPTHGKSFPSGHTSQAFAVATTLSMQYKKWYVVVPAYLWAGGVGYSRMYLGKHYPSDVLGGAAVGVGSAFLSRYLTNKLFRQKKTSATHVQ